MFAEVEFEWTVVVQPEAMRSSDHINRAVILALVKDFNDMKCTEQHGYHVVLTTLENIGEGTLWERRGCAAYPVRFRCVVFNVVENEHVFAVVTEAGSDGIWSRCGPIEQLFIRRDKMADYEFLVTDVDSLEVTKWRHSINGTEIKKGDVIRVEILATKWDAAQRAFSAVGALRGEYTGVDDRWPELKEGSKTNHQQGGAADDGAWEEQDPTGAVSHGGWEASSPNEAQGGWGQALTNEDDIGTSAWD